MSSVTDLATCLHCIFAKESSHYKLAGKKTLKKQNTPKSPAGTMASFTQDFFLQKIRIIFSLASLLLSCILLTPQSFGSHFSHGATLDQVRGMRLPPGEEGSGQGSSLSRLPLQMGQVPCTERVQSTWMRRSALAVRMRHSSLIIALKSFMLFSLESWALHNHPWEQSNNITKTRGKKILKRL